jgi:hypothetical protein
MYRNAHYHARNLLRDSIQEAVTGTYTYTRGRLPQVWQHFQRTAEIAAVFDSFYKLDLVATDSQPDDLPFDDLYGDGYDESHADTIPGGMRELNAQRKAAERRLEDEGHWVMFAVFNASNDDGTPDWHTADSIGGFVGEDFWGSGYEDDLRLASLDGLFDHYGGKLPDYVPSKTGAWTNAVLMGWQIIQGNTP